MNKASPVPAFAKTAFIFACLVGLWLFLFGERFDNLGHGRVVEGKVADISARMTRGDMYYRYRVVFEGHEKWTNALWYASVGDKVNVNYLPEDPKRAYVQWGKSNSLLQLLFNNQTTLPTLIVLICACLLATQIPGVYACYKYGQK